MYHFIKMIPNRNFFSKVFGYSDLRYIFAIRKGGAIAQSVEQWTENPCVPVPITPKIRMSMLKKAVKLYR
jgi:hypothetical protein